MYKKLFASAIFAFALAFTSTAQKFACVDITAVLESMSDYQKAQQQLDQVATQWRQEIAVEQDKIKAMYSKYQAEQVLLSEEMKRQREEEITTKEKDPTRKSLKNSLKKLWEKAESSPVTAMLSSETPIPDSCT